MLTEIHEHTVDLTLLPEKALIADLGCYGMEFTNYFRGLGHTVHAVDIQILDRYLGDYDRIAIAGYNGETAIVRTDDLQATHVVNDLNGKELIACLTLETYMLMKNVNMYDLIKCDSEGSEYPMIMALTKPPARQLSLEMHLHTGVYTENAVTEMVYHLSTLGYEAVSHKKEDRHCAGENYWSSLFILQE